MYQIEDFNICSSMADNDVFFNNKFREALTMAIQYQLDKYEEEHSREPDPDKLTLYFYPESDGYWFEIKDRKNNPSIFLMDSMKDWIEKIK